ncbi:MAG: 4-hydroxythreonine-4-phosphate dehydrogenase PdxA [Eubacteriales bacterium]
MNYIGITMGDPAGVGPEIILKALSRNDTLKNKCIIYGSINILTYYNNLLKYKLSLNEIKEPQDFHINCINVIDVVDFEPSKLNLGKVDPICGDAAYFYVERAIHDALDNYIQAVVTAPINKEALRLAGHQYDGHTEIFAKLTNTKKYSMMLADKNLRVMHISTHTSLRNACNLVKKERIKEVVTLANDTLLRMNISNPKIAVAGLNPHSGEGGLFGDEEVNEIIPAINEMKENGFNVFGPIPPDVVFLRAHHGHYDMVIAMYHDQGHIPLKLLGFNTGVNVTIGLPIIRTSVDHGTAFDIAGKDMADETSLLEAIKIAEAFNKE